MGPDDKVPYHVAKMLADKWIACVLLALFSPVIALILVVMPLVAVFRPQDRGPLVYRERRFSRGESFHILKFRVLRNDVIRHIRRTKQHARIYEKDAANLTLVGAYLKKWYLDELPQLMNILRGDMSLVGPRPWPEADYRSQLAAGTDYRRRIIAGWTGPGQLCKGRVGPDQMGRCSERGDKAYVRLAAKGALPLLAYDLRILLKTVRTMAEGKGLLD